MSAAAFRGGWWIGRLEKKIKPPRVEGLDTGKRTRKRVEARLLPVEKRKGGTSGREKGALSKNNGEERDRDAGVSRIGPSSKRKEREEKSTASSQCLDLGTATHAGKRVASNRRKTTVKQQRTTDSIWILRKRKEGLMPSMKKIYRSRNLKKKKAARGRKRSVTGVSESSAKIEIEKRDLRGLIKSEKLI